jgi:hypothetical protein
VRFNFQGQCTLALDSRLFTGLEGERPAPILRILDLIAHRLPSTLQVACGGDFGMDCRWGECSQIAATGGRRSVEFVMQVKPYVT